MQSNIISEIEREAEQALKEAENKAQKIIDDARRKAQEILSDESYRIDLERWRKEHEEKIAKDVEEILLSAKKEAELLWSKAQKSIQSIAKRIASMVAGTEIP